MEGGFARRDVDLNLTMTTPDGRPLGVRLTSLAVFVAEGAASQPVLTFTMPLSTYLDIEDKNLFEVSLATTAPQQGPVTFWDTTPIELEVTLLPDLARRFDPVTSQAADIIDQLVLGFDDQDDELMTTSSYRWHRVLQVQPSSQGTTIKLGLRSIFP